MAVSDRLARLRLVPVVAALALAACAGSGPSKPDSLPPDATGRAAEAAEEAPPLEAPATDPTEVPPAEIEAREPDQGTAPPETEPEPGDDPTTVVIDTGAKEIRAPATTLAEAARAEQERRRASPPSQIVITDKNLADYATGQLTVMESSPAGAQSPGDDAESAELVDTAREEAYWTGRAREIRQAWRDAADSIGELEAKVAELRNRFYAEDDGFYRDSQIKPAWDRTIEELERAQQEVVDRQQELEAFLEEGRRAGALPGWLRAGIELEPKDAEQGDPIHEPSEPVVYDEDGSADPP